MCLREDAGDPREFEANTNRQRRGNAGGQSAVKVTTSVAEAVAGGVKSNQREQNNLWCRSRRIGRNGDAVAIGGHGCFGGPRMKQHGRVDVMYHRYCRCPAVPEQPGNQRSGIEFTLYRDAKAYRGGRPGHEPMEKVAVNAGAEGGVQRRLP